jgi:DNA-binding response OmpR family regulator
VLIVDVLLPGMSGPVLVRRVKSEQATRHIIANRDECAIDSGCIALLPKPIDFEALLGILRATLVQAASSASETGRGKS